MDIDLDDLLSTDAANTAKAGIKFQPKGKPKPKPKPNPKPKPDTQSEPESTPTPSTQVTEVDATTKEQTGIDANQIIGNVLDSLQSSFEKPQEDVGKTNAESLVALDSPDDFLPESILTETQTIDISMDERLDAGPTEPELINNIDASENLQSIAELDPLTGQGAAILNDDENIQMGNISPGSKEAWEPLDILTQSGPRVGKFKPKPKAQSRKLEQIPNNPDEEVGPTQTEENLCSISFQPDIMEHDPDPSFTPSDDIPTETTSDYYVNDGITSLQLVDEAENEVNNNDEDYIPENEYLIDEKSKSKKSLNVNKKPGRKRKKDIEVQQDEITEVPKKKFKHGTKRNKRPVNSELLSMPEDELEMHKHTFPLRDLIRLKEHKEKIEKKEALLLQKDTTDPSDLAQNATYYNYHTHMKITPRMRWTKLDTELFYKALQQFGPDLSMIKECFPERTRDQIKLKYKKEEKLHRARFESVLNTRLKDYSHYEFVIERIKQARAEESENDDPTLADEEDDVAATANNESGNVKLQKEVKDNEPDVPAVAESPTKSNDIEDDFWSQYKSDI